MPGNKRPRKKYRPRPTVKPMNIRNRWLTEGDLHALLMAIGGGTVCEQHLADLVAPADVAHRIASSKGDAVSARHAHALYRTAVDIQVRNLDRGGITVTRTEEAAIRASASITMRVMESASNMEVLRAAQDSLKMLEGGSRVRGS